MSDIIDTVQIQEVDDALIELFDITLPDGVTTVHFMNGMDLGTENIYFPQKTISGSVYPLKEYIALPIELTGLASSSSGTLARPSLVTANIPALTRSHSNNSDGNNDEEVLLDILEENGIRSNQDLLGSKVVYRRTLFKYTYKEADSAPSSAPVEFPSAKYILDRVAGEDNLLVNFELASPMDIEGVVLPSRVVIGKYCPWKYQGHELANEGGCTWPLNSNNRFYDRNDTSITVPSSWSSSQSYSAGDKVKTTDGTYIRIWQAKDSTSNINRDPRNSPNYWFRIDGCAKLISSCKVRFQNGDTSKVLPFGGFPGARTFK